MRGNDIIGAMPKSVGGGNDKKTRFHKDNKVKKGVT